MGRVLIGITVASALISLSFGVWGLLAFPVVMLGGLLFGIPLILLCKKLQWLSWWTGMFAGFLAPLPYVWFYLTGSPGHIEHVGLYNSVFALGVGSLGGLIVWLIGVFRNEFFMARNSPFPASIVLSLPILLALFFYWRALAPVYIHGCITAYEPVSDPTSWNYSRVTVVTDNGDTFVDGLTVGSSDPKIVGNCVLGSKKRTATLLSTYYTLHSTSSDKCSKKCPNQVN